LQAIRQRKSHLWRLEAKAFSGSCLKGTCCPGYQLLPSILSDWVCDLPLECATFGNLNLATGYELILHLLQAGVQAFDCASALALITFSLVVYAATLRLRPSDRCSCAMPAGIPTFPLAAPHPNDFQALDP
jgi:hypothetical protein